MCAHKGELAREGRAPGGVFAVSGAIGPRRGGPAVASQTPGARAARIQEIRNRVNPGRLRGDDNVASKEEDLLKR